MKKLTSLGMADDHKPGAGFFDHATRYLAGKRAFFFPVKVLSTQLNVRLRQDLGDIAKSRIRRANNHVHILKIADLTFKQRYQIYSLADRLVKLPVSRDHSLTAGHIHLSSSA